MSTGNKKVDIFLKKFLTQQQITENFFDYLESKTHESLFWVFRASGVFTPDVSVTPILSSPGANLLNFSTPLVGTNGSLGNILQLDPIDAQNVQFQNTNAIIYHTGLRFNRLPIDTEVNVRTGKIKYTFLSEAIGERAEPDAVVDNGNGTLTITVDQVAEPGVSNAGRKVIVWLKEAVSQVEAFEECTVIFSGGANKIITTGALGQQIGNISVDATKYEVFLKGPTIRRNTDLRLDANVIYTGAVTGNAGTPTVFDHSDVNNLSAGFSTISSLFYAEHSNVDGSHTNITPQTIVTKQSTPGVQLDTRVNASDEDVPDAPVSHTLFPSAGGTGIQGIKWRLRDSTGAVIAMIDAHGNAYFQNLAAISSVFQENLVVTGDAEFKSNSTFGDNIASDLVTFNAKLQSLSDFHFLIDSNNDETGKAFKFYNNSFLNEIFRIEEDGDLQLFGNLFSNNPGLNIDLDSDNNTTGEVLQVTKNGGLTTLLRLLETGKVQFYDSLLTDLAALSLDLDNTNTLTGEQFSFTKNAGAVVMWLLNEFGDALTLRDTKAGRDVLTAAKTNYKKADGTDIATNASLNETHDESIFRKLLKVTPNNPADKIINIAAARITAADGSDYVLPVGVLVSLYNGGTVNFGNGTIVGGGTNFTPKDFAGNPGKWFKYSLNLLVDNTVLVLQADSFGTTKANAPNAPLASGAIGFTLVAVQDDGSAGVGTILNITEANLDRIPAAGGGGSGTGDADVFEEDVKARWRTNIFSWLTLNSFRKNQDDFTDPSSTAVFDNANNAYRFPNIGSTFLSLQNFLTSFLTSDRETSQLEVILEWLTHDPAATYEVSIDGGVNWNALAMNRVGTSFRYQGFLKVPSPTVLSMLHQYAVANADGQIALANTGSNQQLAFPFIVPASTKEKFTKPTIYLDKLGTPTGGFTAKVVKDSAGLPSTNLDDVVATISYRQIADLAAGNNTIELPMSAVTLAGKHWLIIDTDVFYKNSYSAGVNELRVRTDSSAPTYADGVSAQYNGTVWATIANTAIVYTLEGIKYDLRMRVISSAANVLLVGYSVQYGEMQEFTNVEDIPQYRVAVDGDIGITTVTLPWVPEPKRLAVSDTGSGQTFRWSAFNSPFSVQGRNVSFPTGSFISPGEKLELIFEQPTGFANDSNQDNANLLASNHLGSTDAQVTRQAAGRGILLADELNSLSELAIDSDEGLMILNPTTLEVIDYHIGGAKNGLFNTDGYFTQRNEAKTYSGLQGYLTDRWYRENLSAVGTPNFTQVVANPVTSVHSSIRFGRINGSSDVNTTYIKQALLTRDSIQYAGKYVCVSFIVKKGANFSGTSLSLRANYGQGVDQSIAFSWTSQTTVDPLVIPAASISSSIFQKFYAVFQVPATATQLGLAIRYTPVGTAGANDWVEVSQIMLNLGRGPAKWSLHGGSHAGELTACQSFYEKTYNIGTSPGSVQARSKPRTRLNTNSYYYDAFKVTKRITPSIIVYNGLTGAAGTVSLEGTPATASIGSITQDGFDFLTAGADNIVPSYNFTAESEL